MACFWGIEVKPGKPVVHSFIDDPRRLRVSQATLGPGTAKEKISVECKIWKKSPVYICTLVPLRTESCQLDLEFEESLHVIFSVIGSRSVYLTGYYLAKDKEKDSALPSDTEYIGDTESDENSQEEDDYDFDDSFIDDSFIEDSDTEVFSYSLAPINGRAGTSGILNSVAQ